MGTVPEIYTENFYEICRAISDHCDRPEMSVTEFGVKYLSEQYIKQHPDQFDVKLGGQITYLGGSGAKVGIPDGYDEEDPIDEYDAEDGYSEVPDDPEPLDFEIDEPSIPDDGEADTPTDGTSDDGDPDSDDGDTKRQGSIGTDDEDKLTFTLSEGPPETDV